MNETPHIIRRTEKDDGVPGRVRLVILQLVRRDLELSTNLSMAATKWLVRTIIRNFAKCFTIANVNVVAPIRICWPAA